MTLKRSAFKPRTATMKSQAFKRTDRKEAGAVSKLRIKSKGMVGRTPTVEEAQFMSDMAEVGCLPCAKDGNPNSHVSIHHIDGRTKPGAHFVVISLCAEHHQQDDTDPMGRISVHGRKKQFVAQYGTERELLAEAKEEILRRKGLINSETATVAPGAASNHEQQWEIHE